MFSRIFKFPNLSLSSTWAKVAIDMGSSTSEFIGEISLLATNLSAVNTGNKLNFAISTDAEGDRMIVTDTESRIYTAPNDLTKGSCSFRPATIVASETNFLYFWFKMNDGSSTLDRLLITYQEH